MANINKFSNQKLNLFKKSYLKMLILKHIIMLLCFAQNYQLLTSKNKLILFTEVNQILLKVRGKGESKIINPNFKFKPYIYYLNDEQIPKKFKESSIDLPESENTVK